MEVRLLRVIDDLPLGIEALSAAAASEGVRNVALLVDGWRNGERFEGPGEALFAAHVDGALAGLGGVTPCKDLPGAERMRRFYVTPPYRRAGFGRILAGAAMQEGLQHARILTCNAGASAAAGPFWESLGFARVAIPGLTHWLETS